MRHECSVSRGVIRKCATCMHTHCAKEQGLMVTPARLLCKMPLLSLPLLAVIANGIGHSHRLTQEAVTMHKEICQVGKVAVVAIMLS